MFRTFRTMFGRRDAAPTPGADAFRDWIEERESIGLPERLARDLRFTEYDQSTRQGLLGSTTSAREEPSG